MADNLPERIGAIDPGSAADVDAGHGIWGSTTRPRCPRALDQDDLWSSNRRPANDSRGAACCLVRGLPSPHIKNYADFAEHTLQVSTEDTGRGMSRGSNHSTQEVTRDTGLEQKAQVGRRKAPAITGSTGLRRRERRFESCRGHHL